MIALRRFSFLLIAALAFMAILPPAPDLPFGVGAAVAQEAGGPDYQAWGAFSAQVEAALTDPAMADIDLEQLRAELVKWREQLNAAQSANQERIATLRAQIEALNPAPVEAGAEESPEIAARRQELNQQLAQLQAPGIAADEAYRHADGLVREIDTTLRERQAKALTQLWPMPINPVNWPAGISALTGALVTIWDESAVIWHSPVSREEFQARMPLMLAYLLFAAFLLIQGQRLIHLLEGRLQRNTSARGRKIYAYALSLGQVVLPMAGIMALVRAVEVSGLIGPQGEALIAALPRAAFAFIAALWLGGRLLPKNDTQYTPFKLAPERHADGRFAIAALGGLVGLDILRQALMATDQIGTAASAVIAFPILLLAGTMLFRIGQIIRSHAAQIRHGDEAAGYLHRIVGFIGLAAMAIGIVGPVLAAIGYVPAAAALVYPAAMTLALLGLLMILQGFASDVYALVVGDADGGDALIPVLISFILLLLALPVLALIWGMRSSELAEFWARFLNGFSLGGTRVSPAILLTFLFVFLIGYMLTKLVQGAMRASILPKTRLDQGAQNALVSGVGYVGIFLAGLIGISAAGLDLSSLAIVAGALSLGIGFGLQNIVQNFVSGIILLIERPISEGDWIEVGSVTGRVRAISVRSTRIETFDRNDVIVPNADLVSGQVTNWTRFNLTGRLILPVSVAYGSDTRQVENILREVAEAQPLVILNPPPAVALVSFGADALNFEIRAILRDVNFKGSVQSDMNHEIVRRFAEEGIDIPYTLHNVLLRNPEALAAALKDGPAATTPAPDNGPKETA